MSIGNLLALVGKLKGVMDERKARELEEFLKKQAAEQDRLDAEARRALAKIQGEAAREGIETSRSKREEAREEAAIKRIRRASGIEGLTPESVIRQAEATGQPMRFGIPGATPSRAAEVNLGGRMGAMRQGISSVLTPEERLVQGEAGRLSELSTGVAARQREDTAYDRRIQEEELSLRRRTTEAGERHAAVAEEGEARLGERQALELDEITRKRAAWNRLAVNLETEILAKKPGTTTLSTDEQMMVESVRSGVRVSREERYKSDLDSATYKTMMDLQLGLTSPQQQEYKERLSALGALTDISEPARAVVRNSIHEKYLGLSSPMDPEVTKAGLREWAQEIRPGDKGGQDQIVRLAMESSLVGQAGLAILNREAEGEQPTAAMKNAQFLSVLVPQQQALQARVDNGTATPEEANALQLVKVMIASVTPEGSKLIQGEGPGLTPGVARQQTANLGALERMLSQSSTGSKYFNIISGTATIPLGRPEQHQPAYDSIVGTLRREKSLWTSGTYNASEAVLFLGRLSEAMGESKLIDDVLKEIGYTAEEAFGQRAEAPVRGASPPISGDLIPMERDAMAEAPTLRQQMEEARDVESLQAAMEAFRTRTGVAAANGAQVEILNANTTLRELKELYKQRLSELSQQVPTQGQPRQRAPQAAPSAPPGSAPPVIPSQRMPSRPPTGSLPQDSGNQDIVGRILRSNHPGHLKKKLLRTVFPDMDDSSLERMTMNYGSSLVGRRTLPREWIG